jgi:hypothetical protein
LTGSDHPLAGYHGHADERSPEPGGTSQGAQEARHGAGLTPDRARAKPATRRYEARVRICRVVTAAAQCAISLARAVASSRPGRAARVERRVATVHGEHHSRHEARGIAGQKVDDVGDLAGLGEPA